MITPAEHSRRPRVLQLSYACSPIRGSEAGVGWHRAVQSARHFDTWVICEEHEFAAEIREYLDAHGEVPGLNFVFVPIDQREWSWGQWHDFIWYAVLRRWHCRAYEAARRLHERIGFNLVHQVTFCGYREPGYLWKLDAPFVWGPIGGTQNYPWRFLPYAGIGGALKEACRSVANILQLRFSPRVRRAAQKAALILAANSTNQRNFARIHGITPPTLPDVGIDSVPGAPREPRRQGPLRILWSGLLVHHKALHLLIRALARLPDDIPYELRVLGKGPLKRRWQRLAERTGVAKHTTWMGWLSHHEALEQLAWAEAFVFSSLRDTTGTVVLEALGAGVPVICLDHQGVHDLVTDECGLKIAVTSPRDVVARLSEAIGRLAGDHQQWARLSRGAIERARDYHWSRREVEMAEWYRRVIEGSLHGKAQPLPSMDFELRRPEAHRLQSAGLARATSTHTTAK